MFFPARLIRREDEEESRLFAAQRITTDLQRGCAKAEVSLLVAPRIVVGDEGGRLVAERFSNCASGPKTFSRTTECNPSQPATRSNFRGAACSKVTSTPSACSSKEVMLSS
ncbi:MAG TPA: hypothetical protein VGI85_12610 [Chthoniobacterales bacterium]